MTLRQRYTRQQTGPGSNSGGSGGGEANTSSNSGTGAGLAQPKSGVDLPFKSLTAGANVTLTESTDEIEIAATDSGEANTSSNSGTGAGLAQTKSGVDLPFKSLTAGANVTLTESTDEIEIAATNSGEANTSSNQGSGEGLAMSKSGVDLPFKSIVAGTGVNLNATSDELEISSPNSGSVNLGGLESFSTGSADLGRGSPNTVWAIHVLALFTIEVNEMAALITNTGTDDWWMGIYDGTDTLIATTATIAAPTSTGFEIHPLTSAVTLTGGQDYWFAIKGNNGSTNWGSQNCYPVIELAKQEPYYPTAGLPASIATGGTVVVADICFWLAALHR